MFEADNNKLINQNLIDEKEELNKIIDEQNDK